MNFAITHLVFAEKLFGVNRTRKIAKRVTLQSCEKEALLLADIERVHAMHMMPLKRINYCSE